jgi:hypothetical protein
MRRSVATRLPSAEKKVEEYNKISCPSAAYLPAFGIDPIPTNERDYSDSLTFVHVLTCRDKIPSPEGT